ncbi:MAG TPA: TIGR02677 family protein [Polyangia bacterium]|nr:TIGR02677 family protein [Polyangia bacterium]
MPYQHKAFAHLNADRAPLYRAILEGFVRAKQRFALHLRQGDVDRALNEAGFAEEAASIAAALAQLVEWNNLEAHPDTADVATVEEFYRPRHLYQLTPTGEAAERAVAFFERTLGERGELQAVALADIRVLLEELLALADGGAPDEGKAHRVLLSLRGRFEELTAKAQAFMSSLQRTIDLHGLSLQALLAYKQSLIDYLERFIGELVLATAEISSLLLRLEERGLAGLLAAAARRELADALAPSETDRAVAESAWTSRWQGLRSWFLQSDGEPCQAEMLRQRARAAIPALLSAVASLNDRRVARSDRAADLRALAIWFAEAPRDEDAHRLWRAAFALAPTRHLTVDQETLTARDLSPVPAQASWLEAPPIDISPRLRESGKYTRPGPPSRVIDRSAEKATLTALLRDEAAQIEEARRRLAIGRPLRMSALGTLGRAEFDLLLDLLGEALAGRVRDSDVVETASTDGSLLIRLEPPVDGAETVLETAIGSLRTPDFVVTIIDAFAPTKDAAAS